MTDPEQREFAAIQAAFLKRPHPEIPSDLVYPKFLVSELIRVRMVLREIDRVDAGLVVEGLCREGLEVPNE